MMMMGGELKIKELLLTAAAAATTDADANDREKNKFVQKIVATSVAYINGSCLIKKNNSRELFPQLLWPHAAAAGGGAVRPRPRLLWEGVCRNKVKVVFGLA